MASHAGGRSPIEFFLWMFALPLVGVAVVAAAFWLIKGVPATMETSQETRKPPARLTR